MSDFTDNFQVPVDLPQVTEYSFPEGDFAEKAQNAEYSMDAAEASMRLLLRQYYLRLRELKRAIEDLEDRLKR